MRQPAALIQSGRRARRAASVLCVLACATTVGCFKYTPVATSVVSPEEEVRVRVTTNAAMRIGPHLGTIAENLEGRLTPSGGDSLELAVWIGKDYIGSPFENARQRVSLGRQEIVEVRRRSLSVRRTALLTVGVLALSAFMIDRIAFEENPNPTTPRGPQAPPEPDFRRR